MDQIIKFFFILLAFYVLHQAFSTTETNNYYYTTTKECYGGPRIGANNDELRCDGDNLLFTRSINGRNISITRKNGEFPAGEMQVLVTKRYPVDQTVKQTLKLSNGEYTGSIPYPALKVALRFVPDNTKSSYSLCDDSDNLNIVITR